MESKRKELNDIQSTFYEYCPRCDAKLQLQRGFDSSVLRWVCRGCGELLYRPDFDEHITWICDECEDILNDQEGFSEDCGEWKCLKCGCVNSVSESEIYNSEDDFQHEKKNPLRGLSDEDVIRLLNYEDVEEVDGREDVILVKNVENGQYYIKKYLDVYNESIYRYIYDNPIEHIPNIVDIFASKNYLIVIEEYIEGETIEHILQEGVLKEDEAVDVALKLCAILLKLHEGDNPIVHRDIKPANVIVSKDNEIYLIDMNVAKWIDDSEIEDTRLLGTQYYAAPEQFGFGNTASTGKTDVYAVGVLINKMLTGKLPKECRAQSPMCDIIDKCTQLNPDNRLGVEELYAELLCIKEEENGR